jgi:hypothetical protein
MVKDRPGVEVDKFISGELKKELPDFYVGTKATGGNGGGGDKKVGGGSGMSYEDFSKLPPSEKLRVAREAEAA